MGKGPLTFVTPAEFRERTALRFSSRSGTTLDLDRAYDAYHAAKSEGNRDKLYQALTTYRSQHGNSWTTCERNAVSGGLLEFLHNSTRPGAPSAAQNYLTDSRAAALIRDEEIPHARFGVLYFLSGIKVETDMFATVVDGLSAAGQTIGAGMTTDFGRLNSDNAVRTIVSVAGKDVSAPDIAEKGGQAINLGKTAIDKARKSKGGAPISFPATMTALEVASAGLSEIYNSGRYIGPLAYVGMAAGAAVAVPAVAVAALVDGARILWDKLKAAFDKVREMLVLKWNQRYDAATAEMLGHALKKGILFAIDKIMTNAVPYLGGAVDLGTGLVKTIDETCTRVASWMDRRLIRIQEGHPVEIANTIEHQMTLGIFGGLKDMLSGAGKMAISAFLPGLDSLVSAVMAVLTWLYKFYTRYSEQKGVEAFLKKARDKFATEKARATSNTANLTGAAHASDALRPNLVGPTILTNTPEFTAFFREGCKASPLIPMLVLNSGLGGSLMTMVNLFDENGRQSATLHGGRKEFDIAADFFARLKLFGARYLKECGFEFLPLTEGDKVIEGYLTHATGNGKEIRAHVEALGWGGRMVAALRG